jgi:hypothetical protein
MNEKLFNYLNNPIIKIGLIISIIRVSPAIVAYSFQIFTDLACVIAGYLGRICYIIHFNIEKLFRWSLKKITRMIKTTKEKRL